MRLFTDESTPATLVAWLRAQGHDVQNAGEIRPGTEDSDWLARAEADGRVILTADKDFGELIFRDNLTSHGVILIRLRNLPLSDRIDRMVAAWPEVERNAVGNFVVVTAKKVRVRSI